MNTNPIVSGKSLPAATSHSPTAQAGSSIPSFESRRPPPQPLSGSQPAPKKGQGFRKQHRNQKRPVPSRNIGLDDEDAMNEARALRNASSRRGQTSITHLLNYTSPPNWGREHDHHSYARSYRRNPAWGPGSGHHSSDKARYVHANYRFVVSPEGSYAKHGMNADEYLDWSSVLQVIVSSQSQAAACPICLSDPVSPRMAKCGHMFCLPCLIRFMSASSSDDASPAKSSKGARWKKCPICEDSIYLHEVRPARFYAGQESPLPRVGDDVVLRLMARSASSTLALPWEGGVETIDAGSDIPWHFAVNVMDYGRIMKGTGEYMEEQYDEEMAALRKQEKEDELLFGQDDEWTQKAIKAITAAKEKVKGLGGAALALSLSKIESSKQKAPSPEPDFFFYASPPHLYLSPLDIRILKTKYGSFSAFPSTLLPRVEHISTEHVVDDALRKRAKYLGHLPNGCLVSFLECDWTDIVPADILDKFAHDIEARRKRNRDKAAQEERERQQAERLESAALRNAAGTRRYDPSEEEPARLVDLSEFQPLVSQSTPPDPRPGFSQLADISTSPSDTRTVWGTRAVAASPDLGPTAVPSSSENDGWLKDEDLFGPVELAMQMEALTAEESVPDATANAKAGSKKKKKQKITLMSTGGRRGT